MAQRKVEPFFPVILLGILITWGALGVLFARALGRVMGCAP
jgi:hypothetical protein